MTIRQTEPEPMTSGNNPSNTLVVSQKHMWQLNLNDALLNKLYTGAYNTALLEISDAKLNEFDIDVLPYSLSSKVKVTYCFYSKSADRELDYVFYDNLRMVLERDISGIAIVNKVTFDTFPWITNKDWMLFIRNAYESIGPLTPDNVTGYLVWVVNSPTPTWHININDSVNWHWTLFKWDGQGDPVFVKQFGEDVTISQLTYYP